MVDSVYTGANFIIAYLETTTDSSGNTVNNLHPVGVGVKVGTFESNYNVEGAYGIGDRIIDVMYSKGYEGSLSFDMILADASTNFSSQWFTSDNVPSADLYLVEMSGDVLSSDVAGISNVVIVKGFKPDSIKVTARAGEYVGVSIDGKYQYLENSTLSPTGNFIVGDLVQTPLIFASASLDVGSWNIDVSIAKEFEVDLKHNIETLKVLNDLYPAVLQEQKLGVDVTLNVYMSSSNWNELINNLSQNKNYITNMYPDTTLTLTVTGSNNTYNLVVTGVSLSSFSTSFEDANVIEGNLKLIGKEATLS